MGAVRLRHGGRGGGHVDADAPAPDRWRSTAGRTSAAWRGVPPLPLTQYAPTYRGPAAQRSEIRVAYDDEALYAAGWFYDDEPAGIRVNSLYRDRWNGDDAFAIYVDAFNDNTNAKWFGTTPAAMRFDVLVSEDGAKTNDSWDALLGRARRRSRARAGSWRCASPSRRSASRRTADRAVMGLTVTRLVSRSGERVTFPDIDPRFEFRRPSQAQDVALAGVRSRRPFYFTPYALAGVRAARVRERRALRGRTGRHARGGRGPALRALRHAHARPHREHRLRAGGGGRGAGRARPLPALLPGEAPLLPGGQRRVRLRDDGRRTALPLAAHRPHRRPSAGAGAGRRAARGPRRGRGTSGSSTCRRTTSPARRPRTSACCGCGAPCSTRTRRRASWPPPAPAADGTTSRSGSTGPSASAATSTSR